MMLNDAGSRRCQLLKTGMAKIAPVEIEGGSLEMRWLELSGMDGLRVHASNEAKAAARRSGPSQS